MREDVGQKLEKFVRYETKKATELNAALEIFIQDQSDSKNSLRYALYSSGFSS